MPHEAESRNVEDRAVVVGGIAEIIRRSIVRTETRAEGELRAVEHSQAGRVGKARAVIATERYLASTQCLNAGAAGGSCPAEEQRGFCVVLCKRNGKIKQYNSRQGDPENFF